MKYTQKQLGKFRGNQTNKWPGHNIVYQEIFFSLVILKMQLNTSKIFKIFNLKS